MSYAEQPSAAVAALEALLFAYGEPLDVKKISALLAAEPAVIETAIVALADQLKQDDRGLLLIQQGSRVQLASPLYSRIKNFPSISWATSVVGRLKNSDVRGACI